jgi:hypothetical protein
MLSVPEQVGVKSLLGDEVEFPPRFIPTSPRSGEVFDPADITDVVCTISTELANSRVWFVARLNSTSAGPSTPSCTTATGTHPGVENLLKPHRTLPRNPLVRATEHKHAIGCGAKIRWESKLYEASIFNPVTNN